MKRIFSVVLIFSLLLAMQAGALAGGKGQEFGVYVKAVEKAEGSFDEVVASLESGLSSSGFQVLASYAAGVGKECGTMKAHVVVFGEGRYMEKVISHGPTAAFALPLRAAVYEDEKGIHVEYVNPSSINRTVLGDDVDTELSAEMAASIQNAIGTSVKGNAAGAQTGQIRDGGYVGGMGGGKFLKKLVTFNEGRKFISDGTLGDFNAAVKKGIEENKLGWKLHYALEAAEGVTLYGISKSATEAAAFDIAGDSREEDDYKCPGLDHAAAFPIEVVVYSRQDGKGPSNVAVSLDEMYRMKVYFEDAGSWAFAKNMSMPGDIEDEIKEVVTANLKKK